MISGPLPVYATRYESGVFDPIQFHRPMITKVLTDKLPFYQYKEIQLYAAMRRKEIPHLPDEEENRNTWGYGGIDDLMWDLLVRCWSYVPSRRPSCKEIQEALKEIGFQDDRPEAAKIETGSSFWQTMREGSGHGGIQWRVEDILRSVRVVLLSFGGSLFDHTFRSVHGKLLGGMQSRGYFLRYTICPRSQPLCWGLTLVR